LFFGSPFGLPFLFGGEGLFFDFSCSGGGVCLLLVMLLS
jgi:hypothetical protein